MIKNNTWESPSDNHHGHQHKDNKISFAQKFYSAYQATLNTALANNDWPLANRMITELGQYQAKFGAAVLPSPGQRKAELLLNKMDVFSRLGKAYGLLGLGFLTLLFSSVFKPKLKLKLANRIAFVFFSAWLFSTFFWPWVCVGMFRREHRGAMGMNP